MVGGGALGACLICGCNLICSCGSLLCVSKEVGNCNVVFVLKVQFLNTMVSDDEEPIASESEGEGESER
jgi:hypothetical protein